MDYIIVYELVSEETGNVLFWDTNKEVTELYQEVMNKRFGCHIPMDKRFTNKTYTIRESIRYI